MKTVVTLFLDQAAKHPKNPAVLDIRGTYTYERMNNRSAYLAERFWLPSAGRGITVGLHCFFRGPRSLSLRCLPFFAPAAPRYRLTVNIRGNAFVLSWMT